MWTVGWTWPTRVYAFELLMLLDNEADEESRLVGCEVHAVVAYRVRLDLGRWTSYVRLGMSRQV